MTYQNYLWDLSCKRDTLIAAHRGMSAGNIPCNTIKAFEIALQQGADILETDITAGKDGELFIFHPGQEKNHLNQKIHLEQMTGQEIRQLRYVNVDNNETPYHIVSLEEFLEIYKNRCIINLDHAWNVLPQVIDVVRHHGMEDQILIKAPQKIEYALTMQSLAPEIMFMPIIHECDKISEKLENMNINFVGSEIVFATDHAPVAQDEYIESQHSKKRVLWCNSILYDYKEQLSGGHSDDKAVTGKTDEGWGWLMDKGFDIIQTDWVMPLKQYIYERACESDRYKQVQMKAAYQI